MVAAMPSRLSVARLLRPGLALPVLLALAACGGGETRTAYNPAGGVYPEPGPPGDPWRPYIHQASGRFGIPQQWIRAVMKQESGGHEYRNGQPIMSAAGAMGLMQLMPATYAELQQQYGLGSDPFEPHDNIMAGTGYIQQMYRRYGAPGFLAAYNAGPQRLDDYIQRGRRLPNETEDYVAAIAPNLGTEIAMSGPLAAYASGGGGTATTGSSGGGDGYGAYEGGGSLAPVRLASYRVPARSRHRRTGAASAACWHDPDAAFDPDAPCGTPPPATMPAVQTAVAYAPALAPSAIAPASATCPRDPDAAFDAPCGTRPTAPPGYAPPGYVPPGYAAPSYAAPAVLPAMASARLPQRAAQPVVVPVPRTGDWAIQVGAFNAVEQARFATTMARQADYRVLAGSRSVVQATTPFGRAVLYRARLAGLARADAGRACDALRNQSIPCMVVPPGG